jgi:hypothetical protein
MVRKELEPSRVMIRCPVTGHAIPTAIMADPATWSSRPIGLNRMSCPNCKQVHAWSKSDAYLERSGGMSRGLDPEAQASSRQ